MNDKKIFLEKVSTESLLRGGIIALVVMALLITIVVVGPKVKSGTLKVADTVKESASEISKVSISKVPESTLREIKADLSQQNFDQYYINVGGDIKYYYEDADTVIMEGDWERTDSGERIISFDIEKNNDNIWEYYPN